MTTEFAADSSTIVPMNINEAVTFREWAVQGEFSWTLSSDSDI
jgi:hypothetical protein